MADDKTSPFADTPFAEMFRSFGKSLELPQPDVNGLIERHARNLQALQQAAQAGSDSAGALMDRQRAALEEALAEISVAVRAAQGGDGSERIDSQMDLARKSFDSAIRNATEMSEIVQKGNADVFNILKDRVMENLAELQGRAKK